MHDRILSSLAALVASVSCGVLHAPAASAQQIDPVHEQVEWTWAEFPKQIDPQLPDVLVEGDSISRAYFPFVAEQLRGKANVFLFATSASVGDPRLAVQLRDYAALAERNFRVVHFNNGLHGWQLSERQYSGGFPEYLAAIRTIAPRARLIWSTTTPVRERTIDGATNERIAARNTVALQHLDGEEVRIDDQNGLMKGRTSLYQDDVHFDLEGSRLQASQVARLIGESLQGQID